MLKPKRKVKCVICGEKFTRWNSFQQVCMNPDCIIENAKRMKKKENRKAVKEFREGDAKWLKKVAQKEVNAYVRMRDSREPCISCSKPPGFRTEAGHYRSLGNNGAIRFNTLNIHVQDHKCNCHMSANLVPYRENLIKKIGLEKVEWLESQTQPRKYTVEYLKKLIRVFRKKNKQMEKRI